MCLAALQTDSLGYNSSQVYCHLWGPVQNILYIPE